MYAPFVIFAIKIHVQKKWHTRFVTIADVHRFALAKKMATQWPGTHAMAYGVELSRVSAAENRISISRMNAAARKERGKNAPNANARARGRHRVSKDSPSQNDSHDKCNCFESNASRAVRTVHLPRACNYVSPSTARPCIAANADGTKVSPQQKGVKGGGEAASEFRINIIIEYRTQSLLSTSHKRLRTTIKPHTHNTDFHIVGRCLFDVGIIIK